MLPELLCRFRRFGASDPPLPPPPPPHLQLLRAEVQVSQRVGLAVLSRVVERRLAISRSRIQPRLPQTSCHVHKSTRTDSVVDEEATGFAVAVQGSMMQRCPPIAVRHVDWHRTISRSTKGRRVTVPAIVKLKLNPLDIPEGRRLVHGRRRRIDEDSVCHARRHPWRAHGRFARYPADLGPCRS